MFEKILIANRGEIALRVHRACHELGIQTVAVHSTADSDAMHVRLADETVCIGPPQSRASYLNGQAIISAAIIAGADAIHPGVGFLSENAAFAEMVEDHGIVFIGPSAEHIHMMGDKITAKRVVADLGLPVVPGSDGPVSGDDEALRMAKDIGYPVLVKAVSGGGGRGMGVVLGPESLIAVMARCRAEAMASFSDDTLYIEKYLGHPRHIEVQIFGDGEGGAVHFGERDCSVQRRHQKVIEEAPSPALDAADRAKIGARATDAVRQLKYRGAGTFEFLYEDGEFFFIEMNTRLQVEHPVSEMISGVDLVRQQIIVAAGEPLALQQADIELNGHAIECRVAAEHPETFAPSPGLVTEYHAPGGPGVRVDSALYTGYTVSQHYDSLVSKLIVHADNRKECIMRMRRALDEYVISGIETTIPLQQRLLSEDDFLSGNYDIHWLESRLGL